MGLFNKPAAVPLKFQGFSMAIVTAALIERKMMGLDKISPTFDECQLLQQRIIWGIKDFLDNPEESYT